MTCARRRCRLGGPPLAPIRAVLKGKVVTPGPSLGDPELFETQTRPPCPCSGRGTPGRAGIEGAKFPAGSYRRVISSNWIAWVKLLRRSSSCARITGSQILLNMLSLGHRFNNSSIRACSDPDSPHSASVRQKGLPSVNGYASGGGFTVLECERAVRTDAPVANWPGASCLRVCASVAAFFAGRAAFTVITHLCANRPASSWKQG